jgi:arsenate reductase
MTAHWGVPDPAAVRGRQDDIERVFREAFLVLDRRISLFLALPMKALNNLALQRELDQIGQAMNPVEHK